MVDVIDGLLEALAGLPLWALAAAVAVVMALEASLLTGVAVPGDLVVLFAASTATTPTRFAVLWAAVAAGSVVGETVGYGIGRLFGERVQASRVGRWLDHSDGLVPPTSSSGAAPAPSSPGGSWPPCMPSCPSSPAACGCALGGSWPPRWSARSPGRRCT
jgi:hypothetical protein